MKRLIGCLFAMILAVPGWAGGATAQGAGPYSIQVRAVPAAEKADALATYRMLRDKGYLVYSYRAEIDGKPWLRIAVGAFDSVEAAAAFGKSFSANEGLEHFVARAPVSVTAGKGGDFVVTPSALWTRHDGRHREVFVFDDPPPRKFAAPGGIRLKPSPDGRAVAFQYGMRVYAVGLGDEEATLLSAGGNSFGDEHDYGPTPHWSPSGRYVAFQDFTEWEVKTSLWVARADGSELRALVDNRPAESQNAVKDFVWHPTEDRIFFVDGHAFGTVSVGGVLRSVDMAGTVTTVREPGKRQEIAGPLRIDDRALYYRLVEHDKDYMDKTYTDARMPIGDQ